MIFSETDLKGVYVIEGNKVRFVEVTTGITGEADIEVTSGLRADMDIVRGPSRVLNVKFRPRCSVSASRRNGSPGSAPRRVAPRCPSTLNLCVGQDFEDRSRVEFS